MYILSLGFFWIKKGIIDHNHQILKCHNHRIIVETYLPSCASAELSSDVSSSRRGQQQQHLRERGDIKELLGTVVNIKVEFVSCLTIPGY